MPLLAHSHHSLLFLLPSVGEVGKQEPLPQRAVDNGVRVVPRKDRAKHVKRTNIRRGLAASVRVRGEDEISERLLQHGDSSIPNRRPRGKEGMKKFSVGGRWFVGGWWVVGGWWFVGG